MFDFHMSNLVYKSQWVERSLPKYIALRMSSLLNSELSRLDSISQLSKTAGVIDIIYAFAKNARWHASPCFLESISQHIYSRYQFHCPQTMDLAAELLGNTTTLSAEADRCFLVTYFLAWHDFSFPESSERICGVSRDWYGDFIDNESLNNPIEANKILEWFKSLHARQSLWQADELKLQIDCSSSIDGELIPGSLFLDLFKELRESNPKTPLSDRFLRCEKAGIIFRVEEGKRMYDLSIDGQKLTARFAVSQSQSLSLSEFMDWCEPWQRCFLQTPSPDRKLVLSGMIQSEMLPKISVLGEFVASLEEEFGEEFGRSYLIEALKSQPSNWLKAALLVAGRHLLEQDVLNQTAASLLDLPSNEIQRLAADVLFA